MDIALPHVNKICFPLVELKIVEISSADVMEGQAEDKTGRERRADWKIIYSQALTRDCCFAPRAQQKAHCLPQGQRNGYLKHE